MLLTDNLHIGIGKLVEAPTVPYRPVTIKVKAVLYTNLDTVLCTLDCKVERLIPVKSASEVLVASSKRVGHPKTSYAAEVLGLVDAVLLSTGCDVHEANGKLLTVHFSKVLTAVVERSEFFAKHSCLVSCAFFFSPLFSTL